MLKRVSACWDTPPPATSPLYEVYKRALRRYLRARQVVIPVLTASQCRAREARAEMPYSPPESQPKSIVGGVSSQLQGNSTADHLLAPESHAIPGMLSLEDGSDTNGMQMEGFQWLLYKHFKRESCILADDMGLGKTSALSRRIRTMLTQERQYTNRFRPRISVNG